MRISSWAPILAFLLGLFPPAAASAAVVPDPEEFRVGISIGGISLVGFIMEYRWGDRSLDVTVGTWTFRDLSVSVAGKQYFGPGDFRPFAGLGLWAVTAPGRALGQRTGVALVARAPIGVEWNLGADHHLGAAMNLNRAVWIQRRDPTDDTPPRDRLIPLPGFYYRWRR
jgi:hypothetical protein